MKVFKSTLLYTGLLLLLSGHILNAQQDTSAAALFNLSLEDFLSIKIKSSGFFERPSSESPGYSFHISSKELANLPVLTLGETINQLVPGMETGEHPDLGTTIGVRGIHIDANNKILVMLDGEVLNQRMHHGYMEGLKSPLLGDYDSYEFTMGPGSLVHGSSAISGYINLIPKNGHDNKGLMLNADYGIREMLTKGEIGYGIDGGENKNLFIYAGIYYKNGFKPDDQYHGIGYLKKADDMDHPAYKIAIYLKQKNLKINFLFQNLTEDTHNSVDTLGYSEQVRNQAIMVLSPRYEFNFSEKSQLELVGASELIDFGRILKSSGIREGGSESHFQLQPIFRTTALKNNSLAAGFLISGRSFFMARQFFREDYDRGWDAANDHWLETGIFSEDIYNLSDRFTVSGGLRFDMFKTYANKQTYEQLSPRIALVYKLSAANTIKASYQHGYRSPDALFSYRIGQDMNDLNEANPGPKDFKMPLEPESMESFEFNIHHESSKKTLSLDLNLYYNIMKNTLGFILMAKDTTVTNTDYFPKDAILSVMAYKGHNGIPQDWWGTFGNYKNSYEVAGGEIILIFRPVSQSFIRISYSYSRLINPPPEFTRFPSHLVKMDVNQYFLKNKLIVSGTFVYRPGWNYKKYGFDPVYGYAYTLLGIKIKYAITSAIDINASVENLLGEDTPRDGWDMLHPASAFLAENKVYPYLGLSFHF